MMCPNPAFYALCFVLLLQPMVTCAQKTSSSKNIPLTAIDSMMMESNVRSFKLSSVSADTSRATLRVRVFEKGGDTQVVQGATVLLKRDKDKMLGRVTKHDGRCLFSPTPATYTVRVQMTGLKTLEKTGFTLQAGQVYDMEIVMSRSQ